jgi:outer membrane lipoprotein SlyB
MRIMIALALAATTLGTAMPANAAGCIKGAAVGGVGGHFVGKGHAVLGAAAGCAYGHHRAAKAARQQRQAQPQHR